MPDVPQSSPSAILLRRLSGGDRSAEPELIALLYYELRKIATRHLSAERRESTLQPTALVNEAYLKLIQSGPLNVSSRVHFLALGARVMRQILVDHSRSRRTQKRNTQCVISLDDAGDIVSNQHYSIENLHDALNHLKTLDERLANIVEMRFFGGMSEEECAEAIGVSLRTVRRDWITARAWLRHQLKT